MSILISYCVYTMAAKSETRTLYCKQLLSISLTSLFRFLSYIFVCISKAFRQEIRELICKIIGKDLTAIRVEDEEY